MAKNGGYTYNPSLGGLPQPKKPKAYKPSAGDLNEKAGGDQEMAMRAENARIRSMNTPARQTAVSAAIAKAPYSRPTIKGAPFTGGSIYRKP